MKSFDKFQTGLEKAINPLASWMAQNKYIKAISEGFMSTLPVTLGVAVIAILANLPFTPWVSFLQNTGLYQTAQDMLSATMNLLGIYVVVCISYRFTKNQGENVISGVVMAMGSFLILMPIQSATIGEAEGVTTYTLSYLGTNGIFVAMLCGLLIPSLYCWLMKKNLKLKLPKQVPPMVSDSLSPTFVAMITFFIVFIVKYLFTLTPFGDFFTFINEMVATPIMNVGTSPWSCILVYTFMNFLWWFGIHPSPILGAYSTVLFAAGAANAEAFLSGEPLPYVVWSVTYIAVYAGGTGCTLGLCAAMMFAKSVKYKEMRKLVIPANIFNINEPIIFGFPLMFNSIYFIPMVFSSVVSGVAAIVLANILPLSLNPTISLPWITPGFIQTFLNGGILLLLVWLVAVALHFLLYLPFFKIDDKRTLEEEQRVLAEKE